MLLFETLAKCIAYVTCTLSNCCKFSFVFCVIGMNANELGKRNYPYLYFITMSCSVICQTKNVYDIQIALIMLFLCCYCHFIKATTKYNFGILSTDLILSYILLLEFIK